MLPQVEKESPMLEKGLPTYENPDEKNPFPFWFSTTHSPSTFT